MAERVKLKEFLKNEVQMPDDRIIMIGASPVRTNRPYFQLDVTIVARGSVTYNGFPDVTEIDVPANTQIIVHKRT